MFDIENVLYIKRNILIFIVVKNQGPPVLPQNRNKKFTMVFMHINVKIIIFFLS